MKIRKNGEEILEKGEENLTEKEKTELSKRYHETFELRQELYKLMKKVIYKTGMGEEEDDYCKALHLDIGKGELIFDPYYQCLTYDEDEIREHDYETVERLIEEIERRYKLWQSKTKANAKIAEDIFYEELDIGLNDSN